jgi:hypothetical protein
MFGAIAIRKSSATTPDRDVEEMLYAYRYSLENCITAIAPYKDMGIVIQDEHTLKANFRDSPDCKNDRGKLIVI